MVTNKKIRFEYNNDKFYNNVEIIHDYSANSIKDNFDKKYGKGKYVVIIIGRSLSSIGKILGYKIGEDNVKNIPLSKAGYYNFKWKLKELNDSGAIKNFKKHLETLGITEEKIKKGDKKYIITDYCISGKSLDGAENLLNMTFNCNNLFIKEDFLQQLGDENIKEITDRYLNRCDFKDFSFVKESYDIKNNSKKIIHPFLAKRSKKLVWFKLLDNEMTQKNKRFKTITDECLP